MFRQWLSGQEENAAELDIRPWDFWKMTPGELELAVEGRRRREKGEWYRTAWMVCYLLKPHMKPHKKLTPESLLPKGFFK